MAQIKDEKIYKKGKELLTVQEFIATYHPTLKTQSVYYAMDNDLVDWHQRGKVRLLVMTQRTKDYKPNASSQRTKHASTMEL